MPRYFAGRDTAEALSTPRSQCIGDPMTGRMCGAFADPHPFDVRHRHPHLGWDTPPIRVETATECEVPGLPHAVGRGCAGAVCRRCPNIRVYRDCPPGSTVGGKTAHLQREWKCQTPCTKRFSRARRFLFGWVNTQDHQASVCGDAPVKPPPPLPDCLPRTSFHMPSASLGFNWGLSLIRHRIFPNISELERHWEFGICVSNSKHFPMATILVWGFGQISEYFQSVSEHQPLGFGGPVSSERAGGE